MSDRRACELGLHEEPERPDDAPGAGDATAGQHECASGSHATTQLVEAPVADEVEDDVVLLAGRREVGSGVVDDLLRPRDVRRGPALRGLTTAVTSQPHRSVRSGRVGAHTAARPVDEEAAARGRAPAASRHCSAVEPASGSAAACSTSSPTRQQRDLVGQRRAACSAKVPTPWPKTRSPGAHCATWSPDRHHDPDEVGAADRDPRPPQPEHGRSHEPGDPRLAAHDVPVLGVDRGGLDADQHLARAPAPGSGTSSTSSTDGGPYRC